jgi:iron-sulfur cluster assembly accessory protein
MQDNLNTLIDNPIDIFSIPTNVKGASGEDDIKITHRAIDAINRLRNENNIPDDYLVRVVVSGGGSNGMSFSMVFDSEAGESDRILESGSINLLLDSKSLFYAMGTVIDYFESVEGNGFYFQGKINELNKQV